MFFPLSKKKKKRNWWGISMGVFRKRVWERCEKGKKAKCKVQKTTVFYFPIWKTGLPRAGDRHHTFHCHLLSPKLLNFTDQMVASIMPHNNFISKYLKKIWSTEVKWHSFSILLQTTNLNFLNTENFTLTPETIF